MSSPSKQTSDHETIRKWAEARGGKPARVKATASEDPEHSGLLRIDFPDDAGQESLEKIDWETFFRTFDAQNLALVYEDETADGKESHFNRFVSRGQGSSQSQG